VASSPSQPQPIAGSSKSHGARFQTEVVNNQFVLFMDNQEERNQKTDKKVEGLTKDVKHLGNQGEAADLLLVRRCIKMAEFGAQESDRAKAIALIGEQGTLGGH
jgi:hypothetical protein